MLSNRIVASTQVFSLKSSSSAFPFDSHRFFTWEYQGTDWFPERSTEHRKGFTEKFNGPGRLLFHPGSRFDGAYLFLFDCQKCPTLTWKTTLTIACSTTHPPPPIGIFSITPNARQLICKKFPRFDPVIDVALRTLPVLLVKKHARVR